MTLTEIQADVASFLGITISASSRLTTTEMNAQINGNAEVNHITKNVRHQLVSIHKSFMGAGEFPIQK